MVVAGGDRFGGHNDSSSSASRSPSTEVPPQQHHQQRQHRSSQHPSNTDALRSSPYLYTTPAAATASQSSLSTRSPVRPDSSLAVPSNFDDSLAIRPHSLQNLSNSHHHISDLPSAPPHSLLHVSNSHSSSHATSDNSHLFSSGHSRSLQNVSASQYGQISHRLAASGSDPLPMSTHEGMIIEVEGLPSSTTAPYGGREGISGVFHATHSSVSGLQQHQSAVYSPPTATSGDLSPHGHTHTPVFMAEHVLHSHTPGEHTHSNGVSALSASTAFSSEGMHVDSSAASLFPLSQPGAADTSSGFIASSSPSGMTHVSSSHPHSQPRSDLLPFGQGLTEQSASSSHIPSSQASSRVSGALQEGHNLSPMSSYSSSPMSHHDRKPLVAGHGAPASPRTGIGTDADTAAARASDRPMPTAMPAEKISSLLSIIEEKATAAASAPTRPGESIFSEEDHRFLRDLRRLMHGSSLVQDLSRQRRSATVPSAEQQHHAPKVEHLPRAESVMYGHRPEELRGSLGLGEEFGSHAQHRALLPEVREPKLEHAGSAAGLAPGSTVSDTQQLTPPHVYQTSTNALEPKLEHSSTVLSALRQSMSEAPLNASDLFPVSTDRPALLGTDPRLAGMSNSAPYAHTPSHPALTDPLATPGSHSPDLPHAHAPQVPEEAISPEYTRHLPVAQPLVHSSHFPQHRHSAHAGVSEMADVPVLAHRKSLSLASSNFPVTTTTAAPLPVPSYQSSMFAQPSTASAPSMAPVVSSTLPMLADRNLSLTAPVAAPMARTMSTSSLSSCGSQEGLASEIGVLPDCLTHDAFGDPLYRF